MALAVRYLLIFFANPRVVRGFLGALEAQIKTINNGLQSHIGYVVKYGNDNAKDPISLAGCGSSPIIPTGFFKLPASLTRLKTA